MNLLTSKRWTAFVLTLITLVVLVALKADSQTTENISLAILLGLPVLLGGESAVRVAETRATKRVDP